MMIGNGYEKNSFMGKRKDRNFKEKTDSISMDAKKLNTGSRDLISLLPLDVLDNILSRLPTKLAASTSVLSKKWRTLFALVHNLDLDDTDFVNPKQSDDNTLECFKNFVDRTLALQCGSFINNFSLTLHKLDNKEASVRRWISIMIKRGVLELYLRCSHKFNLPSEIFRSKTLVKLTIGNRVICEKLSPDLSLPALKILSIESIFFEPESFCNVFLAGCPVLEELSILHVSFEGALFCIRSQTIKKLKVYYANIHRSYFFDSVDHMSFDAPKLVSLDYTDDLNCEYIKVNLKSLVEAKLDLTYSDNFMWPDIKNLVIGIRNVETLNLSSNTVSVMSRCCKKGLVLPVFNNLVNLSFVCYNKFFLKLLLDLLKQSPKLETLTIEVLDVHGHECTSKKKKDLKSLVWGTKCLEIKKGAFVLEKEYKVSRSLRPVLEFAAQKCSIKLEISSHLAFKLLFCVT